MDEEMLDRFGPTTALDETVPELEENTGAVFSILVGIVEGWSRFAVRVKQDGKMQFLPLNQVRNQKLLLKYTLDLIKQASEDEGIVLRRKGVFGDE